MELLNFNVLPVLKLLEYPSQSKPGSIHRDLETWEVILLHSLS